MSSPIPIIDFKPYLEGTQEEKVAVANQLFDSLQTNGIALLKNYDSLQAKYEQVMHMSKAFFNQALEDKLTLEHKDIGTWGYNQCGSEKCSNDALDEYGNVREVDNSKMAGEPKESLDIPFMDSFAKWPQKIPNFKETVNEFLEMCHAAVLQVMNCIAIGLHLDPDYFREKMSLFLRLHHYVPVPKVANRSDLNRIGAHTDFGGPTLLFQDDNGGLQIKSDSGEWVDVPGIPGTFAVHGAELITRWTNDKIKAVEHRVIAPVKDTQHENYDSRYSVVIFGTPKWNETIECLPGCAGSGSKYSPVNTGEYIIGRVRGVH